MIANWFNTASLACRLLGLAIVISLALAPLSMSYASSNSSDHASGTAVDNIHVENIHHGSSHTNSTNDHDVAETLFQSDCASMADEAGSNSCCLAFCANYILIQMDELGHYSQDKSYELSLVNAVISGKPEAPHRPPNS